MSWLSWVGLGVVYWGVLVLYGVWLIELSWVGSGCVGLCCFGLGGLGRVVLGVDWVVRFGW